MLKQGASSHNLALHETQRQREEIPLLKGRTDLLSFKDKKDKKGSVKKKKEKLSLKIRQLSRKCINISHFILFNIQKII